MRFAGAVRFDVTEITGMAFGGIGSAMMLMRWIEMRASRSRIGGRAIPFVMNVKSVLSRTEILDVTRDLDLITAFRECDSAGHFASRFRLKFHRGFGSVLSAGDR